MNQAYIQETVGPLLAEAMRETVYANPPDPVDYLAKWLLRYRDNQDGCAYYANENEKMLEEREAYLKQLEKERKIMEEERKKREEEERIKSEEQRLAAEAAKKAEEENQAQSPDDDDD